MNGLTQQTSSSFGWFEAECCRKVAQALAATGCSQLKAVTISMREGLVTLRGRVNTYYAKQLAQETARRVDSVEALRNEIVVR